MELMKKDLIMTSLEIAEITGKEHKNVLADIRSEIESIEKEGLSTELIFKLSEYKDSTGRKLPMYTFGREGAMQIATRYSAAIRRKLIMKLEELENKIKVPTTLKEALQLALEQQEKLEKQQLVIQEKSKIIKEKVEVIDNLTEDVDSVLLRKIATDYVSKKAKETSKPHPEIWGDIYGLFGRELKINLANRFDKYKQEQYDLIAFNLHYNKVNNLKGEDKKTPYTKKEIKKLSKVEYICKVLKKGGLLIEIMAKVFEIPTEDIIGKYKDYEFDDTREIILIDGSNY